MAGSRAIVYVAIFLPVNILVITRMAGLPFRRILRMLPSPLVAGLAGFGVAELLQVAGLLDALPAIGALLVSVLFSLVVVVVVLALLEPEVRRVPAQIRQGLRSPGRSAGTRSMAAASDATDPGSFSG
jgi:hypothetical protein